MRRQLAALAALTVIVLGTPAIALASTITAESGPLAQVRLVCPPRALTFDLAPGSSTLTEVFGPVPAPPTARSVKENFVRTKRGSRSRSAGPSPGHWVCWSMPHRASSCRYGVTSTR
jgi:hypothetical protein